MSKLELIEMIALAAIVFIGFIVLLIVAIKNGWIKKLTKTLNEAMYYADHNISGAAEKKKYVLSKVEEKCIELGIPWFLIYKVVNRLIEKVVTYHNVIDHEPKNE